MLPKRLAIPVSLAVLTLAGACHPDPAPDPNDPCQALSPDCTAVEGPDGGLEYAPDDGGVECIC
jgi:hypothetical protein